MLLPQRAACRGGEQKTWEGGAWYSPPFFRVARAVRLLSAATVVVSWVIAPLRARLRAW